jgi:non-ribosomal peptide synthetase component F
MGNLGSSIVAYYCDLIKNRDDASFNTLMPSYLSYIEKEKLYLESNRIEKDKDYWESTFDSAPERTVLKSRKSNIVSAKSRRKTFIAPKKFAKKLRDYCAENKVTPYPLFLSALAMYINRVTEKEDIILGTPILNRLNHADKNTSGMFINTIPLRININSEDSFMNFSQSILNLCSTSYRHQKYPYDRVLKFVREKHNFSENLFDIVLSYQNSKFVKSSDVEYTTRWHFNEHQSNSLTVHINDRDDDGILIIDYDYHTDLYYDKEIEFIHQHMLSLLWHALDNPANLICKIEMLTENEKKKGII